MTIPRKRNPKPATAEFQSRKFPYIFIDPKILYFFRQLFKNENISMGRTLLVVYVTLCEIELELNSQPSTSKQVNFFRLSDFIENRTGLDEISVGGCLEVLIDAGILGQYPFKLYEWNASMRDKFQLVEKKWKEKLNA